MSKTSVLFVALPPEDQETSVVYRNLRAKVDNNGSRLGEVSIFPIPQFKVADKQATVMLIVDRDIGYAGCAERRA
jgi:hypothetical protein